MSAFEVSAAPLHCNCGAHDEIAIALERTGAAEGAYMLAWRARGKLLSFYVLVVALVAAVVVLWLGGQASADRVDRSRAVEDRLAGELVETQNRLDALEAEPATADVVVAAAPAAPPAPAETEESEEAPVEGPRAPATPTSAPPDTTIPAPTVVEPAPTAAPLVDGCVLGVCVKVG